MPHEIHNTLYYVFLLHFYSAWFLAHNTPIYELKAHKYD
jgi:hypothetical protein